MYKSYEIRAEAQRVEEARMSKLTELLKRHEEFVSAFGTDNDWARDINHLLSLLEEKDKALAFYASYWNHDVKHEDTDTTSMQKDRGEVARTALNTTKEEQ